MKEEFVFQITGLAISAISIEADSYEDALEVVRKYADLPTRNPSNQSRVSSITDENVEFHEVIAIEFYREWENSSELDDVTSEVLIPSSNKLNDFLASENSDSQHIDSKKSFDSSVLGKLKNRFK
jgi:hypothetical protein